MDTVRQAPFKRIAFIGNYLPRQCGIATFTTDLCEAIAAAYPETTCFAMPVNDTPAGYDYPPRVRFELAESDTASYRRAADFLNGNNVDLVCLQHEYGIFGGTAGSHILSLLRELRMPVVTTLHTVLREPDANQRRVMEKLAQRSDRLVVMSERGMEFLRDIYRVPADKVDHIPHGIPDVPFVDPSFHKDRFGVEGKLVLLTFGLLAPNKGLEYVIEALPAILARYPQAVYIVLGVTHPHVKRHEGEFYRLRLERLARTLGVESSLLFYDRFVSLEELIEFIGAADIYVTPYLNAAQITSGTLAYTVGAGKAIISTPYWYAEELLAEGRGLLVPFANASAIAERVLEMLDNEPERHAMRKRAYLYGREMTWPKVAARYMASFAQAHEDRIQFPRPVLTSSASMSLLIGGEGTGRASEASLLNRTLEKQQPELPLLNLEHLRRLTDDTGLIQHACFNVPNYDEGYSSDDNARALIVAVSLEEQGEGTSTEAFSMASRYLAFLRHSFNHQTGRFRNFLAYDRRWLEEKGSDDCHGRCLWALGTVIGRSNHPGLRGVAGQLVESALPAITDLTSPRAWSFILLGIHEYLKRFAGDRTASTLREELAERLLKNYRKYSAADWPWFEDRLTYCNAALPHALLISGQAMGRDDMVETALKTLEWLAGLQTADRGHFVPIGSNGFYLRGGTRARFDQQPVEAHGMVSACLAAHANTGESRWSRHAHAAFDWFFGRNDLHLSLYDPATGGCRDGLHSDRLNQNEGAESTLAFLMALLEIQVAQTLSPPSENGASGSRHQQPKLKVAT
ncbi:MAG TPA: glycosyltransferase family 4 protein [Gemmataceae bacterium]|nr:glycosyltransferase family 4 protein [Gemmataceae bacterium]